MNDQDTIEYYRLRAPEYEQIYFRDDPRRRRELEAEAERLAELATGRLSVASVNLSAYRPCQTPTIVYIYWLGCPIDGSSRLIFEVTVTN